MKVKLKLILTSLILCFACFFCAQQVYARAVFYHIAYATNQTQLIKVPLENQNSGEQALENGCEVTALSMLLNYHGYQTDKNQLADLLDYVPVYVDEENEIRGNPRDGFVGDIEGGYNAMGVFVGPIAAVANQVISSKNKVVSGENVAFSEVEKQVLSGNPVWVEVSLEFQVPTAEDFRMWETTSGTVKVSPLCHAAVITGMNQDYVYVNDPYGYQNKAIKRSDFIKIYQAMGSQALYLVAA